ncbi:MAG: hypothetical protein OXB88_00070 [Bacteriovoracales bacterium]|nr:hypothetical protein [Bacteriovoracales bacterium]
MAVLRICVLALLPAWPLFAETGIQGKVTLENERYRDDGEDYAHTIDQNVGVLTKIDAYAKTDKTLSHLGFAWRENDRDKAGNMLIFQDSYFSMFMDEQKSWKVLAGYKLYNWSVLEAFHPTARLHSSNYSSFPEEWEKLPEAVVELEKFFDFGTLSFYFFPRFQEPIFPDGNSRKALIDNGSRIKMSKSSKIVGGEVLSTDSIPQFGFRGTWSGDGFDTALHVLRHVDRKAFLSGTHEYRIFGTSGSEIHLPGNCAPAPTICRDAQRAFTFSPTPYFIRTWELGATLELAYKNTLFKFEGVRLKYDDHGPILSNDGPERIEDHTDIAIGIEKSIAFSFDQEMDVFIEWSRFIGPSKWERAKIGAFQQDLFVGVQHRFNNELDSKLKLNYITDTEGRSEKLYSVSYSQRLGGDWSLNLGGRKYKAPPKEESKGPGTVGLENYHKDDSFFINLSRHI